MKDQLMRYIELLFADAPDAYELRHEVLHDTMQRYDDACRQGIPPKEAYLTATEAIGDIDSLLFAYRHQNGKLNPDMYRKKQRMRLFIALGFLIISLSILLRFTTESLAGGLGAISLFFGGDLFLIFGTISLYHNQPYITNMGKKRTKTVMIIDITGTLLMAIFMTVVIVYDSDASPVFLIMALSLHRPLIESAYDCVEVCKMASKDHIRKLLAVHLSELWIHIAFVAVTTALWLHDWINNSATEITAFILLVVAGGLVCAISYPPAPYSTRKKPQSRRYWYLLSIFAAILTYHFSRDFAICGTMLVLFQALILLVQRIMDMHELNSYLRQSIPKEV